MDALALGQFLREHREAKELTLDDAVNALRIRRAVLEAFEQGRFTDVADNPIQIRGFLSNYARYLGLDDGLVLQYYQSALEEAQRRSRRRRGRKRNKRDETPNPTAPRRITDTQPSLPTVSLADNRERRGRSLLSTLLILVVTLASLGIIIFITVELIRTPEDGVSIGSGRVGLLGIPPTATATITRTPTPFLASPTPPAGNTEFTGDGVLVNIELTQRTWLQILVDGEERFAGLVTAGAILEYQAFNNVEVIASNARALDITHNGEQQRSFGGRGQSVDLVFRRDGVEMIAGGNFEPTPEQSPTPPPSATPLAATLLAELTPTDTPGPTLTPSDTPTITLTPSITPTPSDTPTVTNTPTITPTPSDTPTATNTPLPTNTPTSTPTPTQTFTPSPTAVLPPRVTQEGLPPTKPGG